MKTIKDMKKAMTQSEIAQRLGVVGKQIINFYEPVTCTMKPKYMDEYNVECVGVEINEMGNGYTTLLVIIKTGSQSSFMNWSQFRASEKLKIQKMLQLQGLL